MTQRNELIVIEPKPIATDRERAAGYVRMSTDHQRYSIEYQLTTIRGYSAARGFELCKIYEDPGRSGLDLAGRPGLKALLTDVLNGVADFSAVLVYDISRWGRFQDVDESAYYEHLCKRSGVRVIYCAEPLLNDSGPMTAVLKSVKRAMAGEYSRELSTKITAGLRIAASLGHGCGGGCPYGLRRVVCDQNGKRLRALRRGEWKGHGEGYSSLEPGSRKEIAVVRSIFRMYVKDGFSALRIARKLNDRGISSPQKGKSWGQSTVNKLLLNEKFIGTFVYRKTIGRSMRGRRKVTSQKDWQRVPGAFTGIIDPYLFWRAQEIIKRRRDGKSNELLLAELRDVVERRGVVPGYTFRNHGLSISTVYRKKFGSIQKAYAQIGLLDLPPHMMIDEVLEMRAQRRALMDDLATLIRGAGHAMSMKPGARFFGLDGQMRCRLDLARARTTPTGASRWPIAFKKMDFHTYVLARIDLAGAIIDFYVIPRTSLRKKYLSLYSENGAYLDRFRHDSLGGVVAAIIAMLSK